MVETADSPSGGPTETDHSHDVYTVANIVTVLRLVLVPFCFAVLISERNDTLAFVLYVVAASTDWVDGQIARRTGTVTEVGKAIDPIVDRTLIASGVVGLYLVDRLPLWTVVVLVARDLYLLWGAYTLAHRGGGRMPVVYIGKVTTALLLAGFSGLILNWPTVPALGWVEGAWLPGLNAEPVALGMWFVYAGVVTSIITAVIYTREAGRILAGIPAS